MPGKTAMVVAHTHWDREWRYPIWRTRSLLEYFQGLDSGSTVPPFRLSMASWATEPLRSPCPRGKSLPSGLRRD